MLLVDERQAAAPTPKEVNAAVVAYEPMTVAMKVLSQVPAGVVTMR